MFVALLFFFPAFNLLTSFFAHESSFFFLRPSLWFHYLLNFLSQCLIGANTPCCSIIITFIPLSPSSSYFSHTVPSFNFCHFHLLFLLLRPFHQSSFLCPVLFITFHSAQQNVISGVNVRGDGAKGQRFCLLGGRSHPWLTLVLMEPLQSA